MKLGGYDIVEGNGGVKIMKNKTLIKRVSSGVDLLEILTESELMDKVLRNKNLVIDGQSYLCEGVSEGRILLTSNKETFDSDFLLEEVQEGDPSFEALLEGTNNPSVEELIWNFCKKNKLDVSDIPYKESTIFAVEVDRGIDQIADRIRELTKSSKRVKEIELDKGNGEITVTVKKA